MKKIIIPMIILFFCITAVSMYFIMKEYDAPDTYDAENAVVNSDETLCGGYFTQISHWKDRLANYYIVYANDTGVKYMVVSSAYKFSITPLYNADGTIQVYENDTDNKKNDP